MMVSADVIFSCKITLHLLVSSNWILFERRNWELDEAESKYAHVVNVLIIYYYRSYEMMFWGPKSHNLFKLCWELGKENVIQNTWSILHFSSR